MRSLWYAPEAARVMPLIEEARLTAKDRAAVVSSAKKLVKTVRAKRSRAAGLDNLMREFSLSSREGVALMRLAEAVLRVPDKATLDALIRDKVGGLGCAFGGGCAVVCECCGVGPDDFRAGDAGWRR
jgi:RHH-type proline utilization regulon transcriptional repressor/proline dehydrogenase/delta 1-pyrroline-5-carboxylate dehydrogenase